MAFKVTGEQENMRRVKSSIPTSFTVRLDEPEES